MAWPADGITDWNPLMKAHVEVDHETDGTHGFVGSKADGEVVPTTTTFLKMAVNGTLTEVFVKVFAGSLSGNSVNVTHGIDDVDKIYQVTAMVWDDQASEYGVYDNRAVSNLSKDFRLTVDSNTVDIASAGEDLADNKYRIMIWYTN